MQQFFYQIKFRNVYEGKKLLVLPGLIWSRTAVSEWKKRLLACVRIVGKHFKQFYCRQLKMEN